MAIDRDAIPAFTTIEEFLLRAPLYAIFGLNAECWDKAARDLFVSHFKIDGHCPSCGRDTTYQATDSVFGPGVPPKLQYQQVKDEVFEIQIECARVTSHVLTFYILKMGDTLQKVGQWPSLADIALDELKEYKALLKGDNGTELHKAIGLAAHGVGIGSFVYLRRIFERLISEAFEEHKDAEGWSTEVFYRQRMPEKIAQLKAFLPEFLVKNRAVYGILSKGLHELTEEECRAYFEPIKMAIFVMLRREKERREREKIEEDLAKSIAQIAGSQSSGKEA